MPGCAFGPCDNSIDNGGAGCDLCDRVAKLPSMKRRQSMMPDAHHAVPTKKSSKKKPILRSCDG
jgi:hypothetical protein